MAETKVSELLQSGELHWRPPRPPIGDPALWQILDKAKVAEVAHVLIDQQIAQATADLEALKSIKKILPGG